MIHDLPKDLVEDSRKLLQQGADYEEFFKKALKKFGVNSPADFKSDEEKKKFFDYVDKNYKGKNEGVSVREYFRGIQLDELAITYVLDNQKEADMFIKKIEKFVDSAVAEKGYGYYRVIAKGSKSDLHKATDVMIKHFSEQLELDEGKKGKYQSKGLKNVAKELAKVEKIEKKNKGQDKEVKDIAKFVSKNLETEMYDDMEILTGRTLKQLDKMMSKLDTDVRDGVAKAIEKADPDLYDMMFGF